MATKHVVRDKNGVTHTRTSKERVYAYAVAVHYPASGIDQYGRVWPATTKVEWRSRKDLAETLASAYRGQGRDVEILIAEIH
jgi:hypothetical protein